ncbi:MAG: response regulator transcription factor [Actinobacteria bacterium]|nr:response regulator transcription factor [Actinomycetota bacterium]
MSIRVAVADDHVLVREGIIRLIEAEPDLDVVGVAATFDELMAVVDARGPDVVVTDIRMPPTGTDEGIRAAGELRHVQPTTGVVVLSQFSSAAYALALLEEGSGGRAYLLKERVSDARQLVEAIREVARGGSVIDPKVIEELVGMRSTAPASVLAHLTPRETEVLAEMAQGKSNAAIASSLYLSERAVEKHTNSIFSKLGVSEERDLNRRVKAVVMFLAEKGG